MEVGWVISLCYAHRGMTVRLLNSCVLPVRTAGALLHGHSLRLLRDHVSQHHIDRCGNQPLGRGPEDLRYQLPIGDG